MVSFYRFECKLISILQLQRGFDGLSYFFHDAAIRFSQSLHESFLVHGEELGAIRPTGRGEARGFGLWNGDIENERATAGGEWHHDGGAGAGRVIAEICLEDDSRPESALFGTTPGLEVEHPYFPTVARLQVLAHRAEPGFPAFPLDGVLDVVLGLAVETAAPLGLAP